MTGTDVVTFGESMLRLSTSSDVTLTETLSVHVGGSESNVAVALARLGRSVRWVSRVPTGALGDRVVNDVEAAGVDVSYVKRSPDARLGVYFVDRPPGRPLRVIYDRSHSAAASLTPDDVHEAIADARGVHVTGITPALSESCASTALSAVTEANQSGSIVTLDINYRHKLWSPVAARSALRPLIDRADLVICSLRDAKVLFGASDDAQAAALALHRAERRPRVVITAGELGAFWTDGKLSGFCPSIPVTIVDRLGAGDAFAAGVVHGILDDDLEEGVRMGVGLAAEALTTPGDRLRTGGVRSFPAPFGNALLTDSEQGPDEVDR